MLDPPGVSGDRRATADAPSAGFRGRFLYAIVSLLTGIPCIWQQHVQACDLSSHLYNAWLVNQVSAGNLPGLYVVPQFTNVLFDHLLSFLMSARASRRSGGSGFPAVRVCCPARIWMAR